MSENGFNLLSFSCEYVWFIIFNSLKEWIMSFNPFYPDGIWSVVLRNFLIFIWKGRGAWATRLWGVSRIGNNCRTNAKVYEKNIYGSERVNSNDDSLPQYKFLAVAEILQIVCRAQGRRVGMQFFGTPSNTDGGSWGFSFPKFLVVSKFVGQWGSQMTKSLFSLYKDFGIASI